MIILTSAALCVFVFIATSITLWIRAEIDERRWRKKYEDNK